MTYKICAFLHYIVRFFTFVIVNVVLPFVFYIMHVFNVNLSYCCIQLLNMQQLMAFAPQIQYVS